MIHSIRVRLILIVSVMLVLSIVSIFLANIFLLPGFYQTTKEKQMSSVYGEVVDVCRGLDWDYMDEEELGAVYDKLDGISANRSISIYIMQISAGDTGTIANINYVYPTSTARLKNTTVNAIAKYVRAMYFGEELGENYDELDHTDNYAIFKVFDERIGSNYIELTGQLPDNYWLYMRANYTGITDNASVSNRFLIIVGLIVTLVSIVVIFIMANRYTKPILKLADLVQEMRGLDFSARFTDDRSDEIGVLGTGINELSEKLEKTISELKTANNELQNEIEKKSEQEEMRREFIANVSHELKTPIALIQGYAEGLKENINDDQESRDFYCEVIIDEASRMNRMVKNLLSLNQLEFGGGQVQMEHFDLTEMMSSVVGSGQIMFEQKDIELRYHEPEDHIMVWADEYMIEEVLTNYISNAVNHAAAVGADKPVIEVKAELGSGTEDTVRVSVFNTGEPIPEDDIDKIWNKFYKVDKARTREYGGNGIGLSIVKAVMEAHNQAFGVKNYDNGVEFWFELCIK